MNEMKVLLSCLKTSSSRIFRRASCAEPVSRTSGPHRGSSSVKPGSKVYVGKAAWMADLLLRRSQVWMPIPSRRSWGG